MFVWDLVTESIKGIFSIIKKKQQRKQAIIENEIRLAQSEQTHNQTWEMRQLANAGWKDDLLFYAFITMFIWAGFCPEKAAIFFENLTILPDWFIKTWFWLIAGILGVKKIGEYAPSVMKGLMDAFKK